jgi:hypothetical protein
VIEMDIGNQRDRAIGTDGAKSRSRNLIGDGAANDFTTGFDQIGNLPQRRNNVTRIGVTHRLHGDRGAATDRDVANLD